MSKEFLYSIKIKNGIVSVKQIDGYIRKSKNEQTHSDLININEETAVIYVWAASDVEAKIISEPLISKRLKGESNGKSKS